MRKKDYKDIPTMEHYGLLNDISKEDIKIMGVYGDIVRGFSKEESLKHYGISEEFYNKNIERVLNS